MSAGPYKVCLLGDFGVGKTSLVARFVRSTFAAKYLTTVGVKVDSKEVSRPGRDPVKLVLWDIAGSNALDGVSASYLRGAAAVLLVADGTREATLAAALDLLMQARTLLPSAAAVLAVNKFDLVERWEVGPPTLAQLRRSLPVIETSAATGIGVEQAFAAIVAGLVP
ncbi:MAG: GTP-binding protein [Dokdonella sp.]|uniref:Rab family GTPase n=1 Tax=Dokdonella sp. TaxID=2291710 RepID=UPI0025C7237B|nr:Rab family GTPase [Dokdonella sp.]MBX3701217.1 GTP-binding protein [Dokdonella sp.]MCW5577832.1 GTP-binding protein [Dokdonella sp.]